MATNGWICFGFCIFGGGVGTTLTTERSDKIGGIRDGKLEPGDEVAVDQYEVSKRGRRTETGGKEKEKEKFSCGTTFCDVATGFAKCYPQISTGAFETILNKMKFEKECAEHGVQVKAYRADNGMFSKEDFMEEIKAEGQRITFSGVGAHHMNGVAERSMRTTITKSRTMMPHSMLRWPDQTDVELWPFAMNHATDSNNVIPHAP